MYYSLNKNYYSFLNIRVNSSLNKLNNNNNLYIKFKQFFENITYCVKYYINNLQEKMIRNRYL